MDLSTIEVLVCDDGSTDGLLNVIKLFEDKLNIRYFYQPDKGFRAASARNMGILNSKGMICIFIDSGIIVDENCISEHIFMHKEKNLAAIGYVYGFDNLNLNSDEINKLVNIDDVGESIKLLEQKEIYDMRETVYREMGDDLGNWPAPWCYFWGGNISVDREDLIQVGMFDESYVEWGGDDVDLGIALFKNNLKLRLCRSASSIHLPHKKVHNMSENFEDFKKKLVKTRLKLYEKYKLPEILVWTKVLDSKKFNRYLLDHMDEWR